jgi:hypothetical protein
MPANGAVRKWRMKKLCSVQDCGRIHFGRGYCSIHYQRNRKYGDPLHPGVMDRRPWLEKFISSIDKSGECWIWTGFKDAKGYGATNNPQNKHKAAFVHRLAYELWVGEIPKGLWVLHRCDNPSCCNPAHLFAGSNLDNIADMVAKKRNTRGTKHPKAKLTEQQVREIRRRYVRRVVGVTQLSREFGLSTSTTMAIVKRRIWKDLSP